MRVSLSKDPSSKPSETLVHVEVSEIDELPTYSHSFKYKVPSGTDKKGKVFGEIIIYTDKTAASGDTNGDSYFFDLEKCYNKDCNNDKCPAKPNRLSVADVFHTKPKGNALQDFGTALFKALFSGYVGQLLKKIKPMQRNGGIYLQLNDNEDLDAIPWEYANDSTTLLVHQRIFARVHNDPQDPLPKLPLRIVTVVPDPVIPPNEPGADLVDLNLDEQFRSFINGFTKNKKAVKLERVFPPTLRQMDAQLMEECETATVLHFMGHCGQKRADGPRALIFEHNDNGKQEYIDASRLVSTSNLRLAFLSACDSRNIARVLVERGVPYTIGSNCPIPNDLAREFEFEFYKFLTGGSTVEKAVWQARASLQNPDDIRRHNYFAGAMVLYSTKFGRDNNLFKCENGNPEIELHEPPHNLTELATVSNFIGCKKEFSKLYSDLKRMVDRGSGVPHVYTIKGIGSQEFVAEAMRRMAHLFPGGIFAWAFNKETTSPKNYFRRLSEVIFSEGVWTQLTEWHDNDIQELSSAILKKLRTHATCLLIFDHADILDLGRREKNKHAETLGSWLEKVITVRDTVKIILTSNEQLNWLKGGLIDLNESSDLNIGKGELKKISTTNMKKDIHAYFEYYNATINQPQGVQAGKHFYGVPGENHAFIDRLEVIQAMQDALNKNSPSSGCRILALKGLGGMGKSQLMLRYCYLHGAAYDSIFWLTVDSWKNAVHSYCRMAGYLGLDENIIKEKDGEQKVIDWVLGWFQERTNWLLLLDNADDEMSKRIFELLPRTGGNIIFTTRQFISPTRATVIPVNKMREPEAIVLLYGVNTANKNSIKFNDAQEIVTELDCMPLAIKLARAYIERTRISFKDYLSKLKEQKKRVELFEYNDTNDVEQYEYTVATVWQLSFERIRALNPTAVQALEACAFLYPENIPEYLFKKQWAVLELISSFPDIPPNEPDSEKSSNTIGEAITVLVEFSFVTQIAREIKDDEGEDPARSLLTIHRLVQKVIYDGMDDEQRLRWAHNLASALNNDTPYDDAKIYSVRTQKIMDTYLPHIYHFVKLLGDLSQRELVSKDLSLLLDRAIWYLLQHGTYFGIDDLVQFSTRVSAAVYGEDHPQYGTSLINQASLYRRQGKYGEAEPLYKRVLAIYEEVLGSEHPHTAQSLNNLAILYKDRGKYDEADPLYKRALAIREKVSGSEHPDTASSLDNLANVYDDRGKHDEAEPLYKRALAIREKVLGSEHPDTATSLDNLAILYYKRGKYDEAEPLYKRALTIREKVLGSEHPDTALSLENLAILYQKRGKYDEAESLYKRALAIREKVLGSEHPETVRTRNNLASLYKRQKEKSCTIH